MSITFDEAPVASSQLALSDNSWLRYITFAALYMAQGIPEGFLFYAMPAWLALHGKSPAEIGTFVGISVLPWSFKLINAPVMDRFTFLPMGRRRPWVLAGQFGILSSFVLYSFIRDPLDNMLWMTVLGFAVSFFSSFQDVAVDGMAIDIFPLDQQARANGVMWGSKTLGISGAVAVGSLVVSRYGFTAAVLLFSLMIAVIMVFPLLLRERPGERLLPWTPGTTSAVAASLQLHDWSSIFKSLFRVFFLPMSFIMGMAVFSSSIGKGLIDTVVPVMTVQELGWADTDYSKIFATANLISGLAGMFIGGALVDFFGRIRMMSLFLVLLACAVGTMSFLAPHWHEPNVVIAFIVAFYTLFVLYTISVFASAMQLCSKRVAATQFTLYMAVSNLGLSVGAALLGPLTARFSYPTVILAFVVCASFSLMMLRFVKLERHQIRLGELERSGIAGRSCAPDGRVRRSKAGTTEATAGMLPLLDPVEEARD